MAAFDDESLGKLLIARYPDVQRRREGARRSRRWRPARRYGRMLTDALEQGAIREADVPVYAARQLRRVVGVRGCRRSGGQSSSARDEDAGATCAIARLLSEDAIGGARPRERAREVFQRTCAPCHKLYGEGGTIGPDLTGSNRANLEYLLANVLDPNGEVQEAYSMVVVTTGDGRTYSGTVASETERQLTLRVVGRDAVVLDKRRHPQP